MTEVAVTLQERLEAAVEDLGRCQISEDVAAILSTAKVVGAPGIPGSCPIAVLIAERVGPGIDIEADGDVYNAFGLHESAMVEMSTAAKAFIAEFDRHGYDEFAIPGAPCPAEICERCNPSAVDV